MAGAVRVVGGAVGGLVDLIGGGLKLAFGILGEITSFLTPDLPDTSSLGTGHQNLRTESNAPRLMIVGKTVTSGPITKYQKRTLNKKEYNLFFTPLAAHPCESVELYQLDGKETSSLSGQGYRIQIELGTQTTPNSTARTEMTNVDENCVGFGITYAYHKYEVNPDLFPNGVQDVKFLVQGIRCYDPRKDTTVGGSGNHRADDESTWEWTENAALINLYWKRFGGDEVLPIEMFDMANLAFEANLCDEIVSFEDKNGNTFTEKRWTCNGVIDLSQGQRIVEDELLKSCGGRWVEAGGKYWLLTAAYRGPATVTLTDDDLKADVERQPYTPLEDRCNAVVAKFIDPASYYQETNCTEIYSEYYRDTRDKKYLQHARQLAFTNSDTMCQRSNRVYMERLAAGDTLRVVVGWKGIRCSPGKVVNVEFKEHNIMGKEYEVIDFDFDTESFTWTLTLQETTAEIYSDSVIPSERDLTPNTDIDNTYVAAPQNINYSPTPNDAWRQGTLTWEHDTPSSVRRYVVLITKFPADSWQQVYYPTNASQDINNLPLGDYSVAIAAENRFERTSVATQILFNVGATSTPTDDVGITILPGRVIVTAPTPPNAGATYEWRYSFEGSTLNHFNNALPAGENLSITISNTPHNASVTVWYRLINSNAADPNWLSVTIPNLVGIDAQDFAPDTFAQIQWSGLPANLGETINALSETASSLLNGMGEVYSHIETLENVNIDNAVSLKKVRGVIADEQQSRITLASQVLANFKDMQANYLRTLDLFASAGAAKASDLSELRATVDKIDVEASLTEFKNVQIGYEDENGDWIVGAPLAQSFRELTVSNAAGEEINVINYMQAMEDAIGELGGVYSLGIVDETQSFTGLEIQGGGGDSIVRLYMDNLSFGSKAGVVFFSLNALTGKLEIGANTEFTGTLKSSRKIDISTDWMKIEDAAGFGPDDLCLWKGEPILDANGDPDYSQLTKVNGVVWEAKDGSTYLGGDLTISGILDASALRVGSGLMISEANKTAPIIVMSMANSRSNTRVFRSLTSNKFVGPAYEREAGQIYDNWRLVNYKSDLWLKVLVVKHAENHQPLTVEVKTRYTMENTSHPAHNVLETISSISVNYSYDYGTLYMPYVYTTREDPWETLSVEVTANSTDSSGKPLSLSLEIQAFNNVASPRASHTITGDTYEPVDTQPTVPAPPWYKTGDPEP